jgi:serine/threonine protein kinase
MHLVYIYYLIRINRESAIRTGKEVKAMEPGHKLGPYEVIEQAGAGGMGEVYKARDSRLDRVVAIKILPSTISNMTDFRERFEREAKAISSLNHANICTLYDIGRENGTDFLVMEYLEGETLANRLNKGSLPYDELLHIAVQISSALDSAHRQGLIHRDLKPGNIMLTGEGAKLMDFGLAKLQMDNGNQGMSTVTRTTPLTGAGTIVGTMQYMSPEQLEGKEADERSDIFAFGAVLYEMSTGKRAFEGTSNATLIAAIMEREPVSISAITPFTPPLFERLVKKCLAKDPQKRWQSAADLSDELRWISQAGSQAGIPAQLAARRKFKFDLARVIGAVFIFCTIILAYLYISEITKTQTEPEVARYTVNIKQGLSNIFWPRISPDGRNVAFHADDSLGTNRIWVRPVNSLEAYPLLNTEDARRFFWSPDGRHLAFFIGNQLKRISISGGQAQLICQGPSGADGSWSTSDLIIFDGSAEDTMKIVPAGGGVPHPAALNDTTQRELQYAWPWFLPDGEHFIFTASLRSDDGSLSSKTRLKLGSVDTTSSRTLYEMGVIDRVEYSHDGYILYVEKDNLMGLPFDAEKLEVTGEPKPIAMKIGTADNTFAFSVSDDGTLLYQTGNQSSLSELVWVDRSGKRLNTVGQRDSYFNSSISPDETKIAYSLLDQESGETDIWIYDLRRNVPTRLTFDPASEGGSVWSPDGKYVYYANDHEGAGIHIKRKEVRGLGEAETVRKKVSSTTIPGCITPDGTKLLFFEYSTSWDIGIIDVDDTSKVEMFTNSSFGEFMPQVSPNGKYVAYSSWESGNREIYVRTLDGSGGKWQISTEHADNPMWRGDGKELFYLTRDDRVMAVDVKTAGNFEAGNSVELFSNRFRRPFRLSTPIDVTADGQKFLLNIELSDTDPGEVVVVQNWAEEFRKE